MDQAGDDDEDDDDPPRPDRPPSTYEEWLEWGPPAYWGSPYDLNWDLEEDFDAQRAYTAREWEWKTYDAFVYDSHPSVWVGPSEDARENEWHKRLVAEWRAGGLMVIDLPGDLGSMVFVPGYPSHRVNRDVAHVLHRNGMLPTYEAWRAIVAAEWPRTAAGQEEARARNAAFWGRNPVSLTNITRPVWLDAIPPRYFRTEFPPRIRLREHQLAFIEERRALGDTVIGEQVFAVGTPKAVIDRLIWYSEDPRRYETPPWDRPG